MDENIREIKVSELKKEIPSLKAETGSPSPAMSLPPGTPPIKRYSVFWTAGNLAFRYKRRGHILYGPYAR
jgi:hypothetical protein